MRYSLRSLMILATVGPAMLAGAYFLMRELLSQGTPGAFVVVVSWLVIFGVLVSHALPAYRP
jgi:hypothetical protein